MSVGEVAQRSGIDEAAVSMFEEGRSRETLKDMAKLVNALDWDPPAAVQDSVTSQDTSSKKIRRHHR